MKFMEVTNKVMLKNILIFYQILLMQPLKPLQTYYVELSSRLIFPIIICNSSNNYGTRQYYEKFIPRSIISMRLAMELKFMVKVNSLDNGYMFLTTCLS